MSFPNATPMPLHRADEALRNLAAEWRAQATPAPRIAVVLHPDTLLALPADQARALRLSAMAGTTDPTMRCDDCRAPAPTHQSWCPNA